MFVDCRVFDQKTDWLFIIAAIDWITRVFFYMCGVLQCYYSGDKLEINTVPLQLPITGHPPNDGPSDGAEDEQAALESAEHVARGAAPEQVVASEYFKVRDVQFLNIRSICDYY